jgi:1-acyl-sn-glycerol-3-phosphate acyltransferase
MRHLRAVSRLFVVCCLAVSLLLVVLVAKIKGAISHSLIPLLDAHALHRWAHRLTSLLALQIEVKGTPPPAPCLLVVNHLGYLDILVLATQVDALFVAKAEIARWPIIGLLCRSVGTIFIDRTRKRDLPRVIGEMVAALQRGQRVIFFPEGTSTSGATVLPFRSPLFEAAIRTGIPVQYASLTYRTPRGVPPAHQVVCWWGGITFIGHVYELLQLPRVQAAIAFGSNPLTADNRKLPAVKTWIAVMQLFTPVDGIMRETPAVPTTVPAYTTFPSSS